MSSGTEFYRSILLPTFLATAMAAAIILLLLLVLATEPARGETITVDDDGEGDYETIGEALDAASDGDTIRVWDGFYREILDIGKEVAIIGNGTGATTIDAPAQGLLVRIIADNVEMGYLSLTSDQFEGSSQPDGIVVWSDNCHIHHINSSGNHRGLYISQGSHNTVEWMEIYDSYAAGVVVTDYSGNNTLENLSIGSPGQFGLSVTNSPFTAIKNCFIDGGTTYALQLESSDYSRMEGCEVTRGGYGCYIKESEDLTILDNTISNNEEGGLYFYGTSARNIIRGNTCNWNGYKEPSTYYGYGIHQAGHDSVVENNVCRNNTRYGIDSAYSQSVKNNVCTGNLYVGLHAYSEGGIVRNNTLKENNIGLSVSGRGIVVRDNVMEDNDKNFGVTGTTVESYYLNIDTSNTINGKAIYYFTNRTGEVFTGDYGYLGLVNCQNIRVHNYTNRNNTQGLLLAYVNDSVVEDSNITGCSNGIQLVGSSGTTFRNNEIGQYGTAIYPSSSSLITLVKNRLWNGGEHGTTGNGIFIYQGGGGHTIRQNEMLSGSGTGISLNDAGIVTIHRNTILNHQYYAIFSEESVEMLTITRNVLRGYGRGIILEKNPALVQGNTCEGGIQGMDLQAQGTQVIDNRIANNSDIGLSLSDSHAVVTGNIITGNEGYGINIEWGDNSRFEDNTITENGGSGIYSYQGGDNSRFENNTVTDNGGSGISHSRADDSRFVNNLLTGNDGTGLSFSGDNCLAERNNCSGSGGGISGSGEGSIIRKNNCSDVIGSGFSVTDGVTLERNWANDTGDTGIYIWGSKGGCTVRNNTLHRMGGYGMWVSTDTNEINDNILTGAWDHGIEVNTASSNIIENNSIESSRETGMRFFSSSNNNQVRGNTIVDCTYGIFVLSSKKNTLEGNTIRLSYSDGVVLDDADDSRILNNTVEDSGDSDLVLIDSSDNFIYGNTLKGSGQAGVFLSDSDRNELSKNIIAGNDIGVFLEDGSRDTVARDNRIHGNTGSGVDASDNEGYEIDATDCWWGALAGPYHEEENPYGKGNEVSDNVLFDPWITENSVYNPRLDRYYEFIQDAIDEASDHDEIRIYATVFKENIRIEKPLTIRGNGSGESVLMAQVPEGYLEGSLNLAPAVNITADDVTLEGFTVQGIGFHIIFSDPVSVFWGVGAATVGDSTTVTDIDFVNHVTGICAGFVEFDIYSFGFGDVTGCEDLMVKDCSFQEIVYDEWTQMFWTGKGVFFVSSKDAALQDNHFSACGVDLFGGSLEHYNHQMSGNTIDDGSLVFQNGEGSRADIPADARQLIVVDSQGLDAEGLQLSQGFSAYYSGRLTLTNCSFQDNIVAAKLENSHNISFRSCDFSNSSTFSIQMLECQDIWVSGGDFQGMDQENAIFAWESSFISIDNSSFSNWTDYAILLGEDISSVLIENNSFGNCDTVLDVDIGARNFIIRSNNLGGCEEGFIFYEITSVEISFNNISLCRDGMAIEEGTGVIVRENIILNASREGISISEASDVSVLGNTITGTDGFGGHGGIGIKLDTAENSEIRDNILSYLRTGADLDALEKVDITGNTVYDCSHFGITLGSDSFECLVEANTLFDNQISSLSVFGVERSEFNNNDISSSSEGLSVGNSPGSVIKGNYISKCLYSLFVHPGCSGSEIEGNNLLDGKIGVHLSDSSELLIKSNILSNFSEYGLQLTSGCDGGEIEQNIVSDSKNGLNLISSENLMIKGNTIFNCSYYALEISRDCPGIEIEDNTFMDCATGIYFYRSPGSMVKNNTLSNCSHALNIGPGCHDTEVEHNLLISSDIGLKLISTDNITITSCLIRDNDEGINIYGSENVTLTNSSIYGNILGVQADESIIDLRENWWGYRSGPYHETGNSEGKGDQIIGVNLSFIPWLTNVPGNLIPQSVIDSVSPSPVLVGENVSFQGSFVDDGEILLFVWKSSLAGELHNGSEANFETALAAGTHKITFLVQDEFGIWSEPVEFELIVHQAPVLTSIALDPVLALEGKPVTFTCLASDDGGGLHYLWVSNIDGTLYEGSLAEFSSSSLSLGTHEITLKVRDEYGVWTEEKTGQLTVHQKPTVTNLSLEVETANLGEILHFKAQAQDDDEIVRYAWSSSLDGEFYNGTEAEFDYNNLSEGEHEISLKVQDENGVWSEEMSTSLTVEKEEKEESSEDEKFFLFESVGPLPLIVYLLLVVGLVGVVVFMGMKKEGDGGTQVPPSITQVQVPGSLPAPPPVAPHQPPVPGVSGSMDVGLEAQNTPVTAPPVPEYGEEKQFPESQDLPPSPEGWICLKCGTLVGEKYRFCVECGEPRVGGVAAVPQTKASWPCPQCQTEVDNKFLFCVECGEKKQG